MLIISMKSNFLDNDNCYRISHNTVLDKVNTVAQICFQPPIDDDYDDD